MKQKILHAALLIAIVSIFNFSCKKEKELDPEKIAAKESNDGLVNLNGHLKQTKTFSSDVVIKWLNMQLEMLKVPLPVGTGSQTTERCQAYCGIALYESVVPGMPAYQTLYGQLTDFPVMPTTEPGKAYHWAACANASLADMNRKLFPTTSAANKIKMDSLENALQAIYSGETDVETLQRSIAFGKEVSTRVLHGLLPMVRQM